MYAFTLRHEEDISHSQIIEEYGYRFAKHLQLSGPSSPCLTPLLLPRLLRIAAHNLDLLRLDITLIIELEIDILDQESPDLVAEPVCIQMTLFHKKNRTSSVHGS